MEARTGRIIVRKTLPYSVDVTSTPLLTDKEIIFGTAKEGLVAFGQPDTGRKMEMPRRRCPDLYLALQPPRIGHHRDHPCPGR